MQPLASYVTTLENVARVDHRDGDGGGSIVRTLYVEPYSAYPWVIAALKGTIKNNGDGTFSRVKPHFDPLSAIVSNPGSGSASTEGFFYCTDTVVTSFATETASGSKSGLFRPSTDLAISIDGAGIPAGNNQLANIFSALNNVDDFDFAANPDTLSVAEIAAGKPDYSAFDGQPAFVSKGKCGAYITATYTPILFYPGIQNDPTKSGYQDPFDYVDPIWTPETKLTQIGRDLQFLAPQGGFFGNSAPGLHGGVNDTMSIPEVVWNLEIRRLMVPFLPRRTFNYLSNKVNFLDFNLAGGLTPPEKYSSGTVLMSTPLPVTRRTVSGIMYYDIALKFKIRMLRDARYDVTDNPNKLTQGDVTWNQHLGMPTALGLGVLWMGYYPVVWNDGVFFQVSGNNRPLFLNDIKMNTIMATLPGGPVADLGVAPFTTGFRPGQ